MKKHVLLLFVLVLVVSCKMNFNEPKDDQYVELSIVSFNRTTAQYSIESSVTIGSYWNTHIYETKTGKQLTITTNQSGMKNMYGEIHNLQPNTEYTIVACVIPYGVELLSKPVTFTTSE